MRARGYSQADVARAAAITEADMSRICARNMLPTDAQAARILEVLVPGDDATRTHGTVQVTVDDE